MSQLDDDLQALNEVCEQLSSLERNSANLQDAIREAQQTVLNLQDTRLRMSATVLALMNRRTELLTKMTEESRVRRPPVPAPRGRARRG